MNIGFLDSGPVIESSVATIEHTIEFAKRIDELGFSRFWLAEHQEKGVAWRSPEVLISIIAGYTENIRIGAAGVLLPLNNSLRIAQHFKMLSTLFPNRIDLGIAKGISSPAISSELLDGLDYVEMLKDHDNRFNKLCFFLKNEIVRVDPSDIEIVPISGQTPNMWYLTTNCIDVNPVILNKSNLSMSLMHFSTVNQQQRIDNLLRFSEKYYAENHEELNYNVTINVIFSEDNGLIEKIRNKHLNKFMQLNVAGGVDECLDHIYRIQKMTRTNELIINPVYSAFDQKIELAEVLAEEFYKVGEFNVVGF